MSSLVQPSLVGGEIHPSLQERVDLALFQTSVRAASNFFVVPTGGLMTRAGTRLSGRSSQQAASSRLARFIYSREQSYLVEFYAGRAAVWSQGARVLTGTTLTVSSALLVGTTFFVTFSSPHGCLTGDVIVITGATGTGAVDELNGDHAVTVIDGDTVSIPRLTGNEATYNSGSATAAVAVTVATPYTQEHLASLRFMQSADVMTVVCRDIPEHELRRTDAGWEFVEVEHEDGPFLDMNKDESILVHASAATGVVTLTASSAIFEAGHVGALFYLEEKNLHEVPPWEAGKPLNFASGTPFGLLRRNDGKTYRCVTSTGTYRACGSVPPTHEIGVQADGDGKISTTDADHAYGVLWEYQHSGYGICRISAVAPDGLTATATVLSRLPDTVVGGAVTAQGPWTMTGDGVDDTLSIAGATSGVAAQYEVTFTTGGGIPEVQPASSYSVNPTTDVMLFVTPPASGVSVSARQLEQDNRSDFWAFGAWSEVEGYPGAAAYYGDRATYASTRAKPQRIDASRVGDYIDFSESTPTVDDDAVRLTVGAREMSAITDIVPLSRLVALTGGGAYRIGAADQEALTPSTRASKFLTGVGAADMPAVLVEQAAVYAQRARKKITALSFGDYDSVQTVELTVRARHLWPRGQVITGMDYAADPYGILWATRSDGALMALTYLPEQEVMGWSRHSTDGVIEGLCVVPEAERDVLYLLVAREIDGGTVRFIERMVDREPADPRDVLCLDCALSYDGRNTGTGTATLTSAGGWTVDDSITVQFTDVMGFSASDVGGEVWFYDADDVLLARIFIRSIGNTSRITGNPDRDLPDSLQGATTARYGIARAQLAGASHLSGREVWAQIDEQVAGPLTVAADGTVDLQHPAVVAHVGLKFEAYIETLSANRIGQETIRNRPKAIAEVGVLAIETRGLACGPSRDQLEDVPGRVVEGDDYGIAEPIDGLVEVLTRTDWNDTGRVQVWQVEPAPAHVIGLIPKVEVGLAR